MSGLQGKVLSNEGIPLFYFVGVIWLFYYKNKVICGRRLFVYFMGKVIVAGFGIAPSQWVIGGNSFHNVSCQPPARQ